RSDPVLHRAEECVRSDLIHLDPQMATDEAQMETGGEAEERERKKKVTYFSLPPDFACEGITAYIYRHYSSLLTDEEAAANRIRMFRAKAIGSHNPDSVFKEELAELQSKHPALWQRIEEQGIGSVMDT